MAYEALAAFYDEFMDDVDYENWSDYIAIILSKYGPIFNNESKIVDLACGTAELTCKLKNKTFADIIAVDNSEEMLSIAAQKAKMSSSNITFYCQDITNISLTFMADAVICTCDGVNYISTEDILSFFRSVYDLLNHGCVFTFDISSEHKLVNQLGDNTIAEDRGDSAFIWENTLFDDHVQIDLSIFQREHEDRFIKLEEQQIQYIHKKDKLLELLNKAGFKEVHAFKFNTFRESTDNCERIQFVAVK